MKTIHTPWGPSQHIEQHGRGILSVSTAGHGGIFVPSELLLQLPRCLQGFKTWIGSPNWFEEDCDAVIPVLLFPDSFDAQFVAYAMKAVQANPYYAEHGFNFDAYILTDAGVRANQIAIEQSNYEVATA